MQKGVIRKYCSLQYQNLHAIQFFSEVDSRCSKIGTKMWLTAAKHVTIDNFSPVIVHLIAP